MKIKEKKNKYLKSFKTRCTLISNKDEIQKYHLSDEAKNEIEKIKEIEKMMNRKNLFYEEKKTDKFINL